MKGYTELLFYVALCVVSFAAGIAACTVAL